MDGAGGPFAPRHRPAALPRAGLRRHTAPARARGRAGTRVRGRLRGSAWARGGVALDAGWMLRRAESAIPLSRDVAGYLREQQRRCGADHAAHRRRGSSQPDYLRAARAAGVPTAVAVWSWDHLTSKALIRDAPDRVLVWNEVQRDEAVRLHGMPPRARGGDRRAVLRPVVRPAARAGRAPSSAPPSGLPDDKPFLLYVGSALFAGSPPEAGVRAAVDRRDPGQRAIRRCAPAPSWSVRIRSGCGSGTAWTCRRSATCRSGAAIPVTDQARADYFDSLAYSRAVVGLNTSAFLEAAIAGRPVLAILPDEFRDNQEGTLHFGYLSTVGGGLLRTSRTLGRALRAAVARCWRRPTTRRPRARSSARSCARTGSSTPATPVFADAVEALAARGVRPRVRRSRQPREATRQRPLDARPAGRMSRSRRFARWFIDEEERRARAWRGEKAEERAALPPRQPRPRGAGRSREVHEKPSGPRS